MAAPTTEQNSTSTIAGHQTGGLVAFRDKARSLLHDQRERIQRVEATLAAQIDLIAEQVNGCESDRATTDDANRALELRAERDAAVAAREEAESLLEESRVAISQASNDQHELRIQISQCHKLLNSRAEELKELRSQLAKAPPQSDANSQELADRLSRVTQECSELRERLEVAEAAAKAAETSGGSEELDGLRERFEMAVQEIRELKARNNELSQQLESSSLGGAAPAAQEISGAFNWEAQKQRLVAELESSFDTDDPEQASDVLTVQGAIRITDQVVAEKEREIADKEVEISELRQLLSEQSGNIGSVAVGAAAIAEILDHDELIREERENLKRLQEEWSEKLRQAEIDVSVERAKLARERMELDAQVESLAAERAAWEEAGGKAGLKSKQKSGGGRWLARLGLQDDE